MTSAAIIQEDVGGGWFVNILPSITGGMNTLSKPYLIDDSECVLVRNARPSEGVLKVDSGYKTLKGTAAVLGTPRRTFEHVFTSGTRETVLVTDKTFYKYSSSLGWLLVSNGVTTTLTLGEAAGSTLWDVVSEVGFAAGDTISVALTTPTAGIHHVTTVVGTAAGQITVTAGLPGGTTAAIGAVVTRGLRSNTAVAGGLNGVSSHEVVLIGCGFITTPVNCVVGTNGVDRPFYYDGSTVQMLPNLPNGGVTVCRTVVVHTNRLVLAGILSDGGAVAIDKLYWSSIGDITTWAGGTSGSELLRDARDGIIAAIPMQEHVILYREHSIVRMEFMEPDLISGTGIDFYFRPMVQGHQQGVGIGALSANAVINYNNAHYVMANDGIYSYSGGFQVEPFSMKVNEGYFTEGAMMNPSTTSTSFATLVDERNDLFFFFNASEDGSVYPRRALVFSADEQAWWERKFAHEIAGAEIHLQGAGITWDEMVGTWDDQNFAWNDLTGTSQRKMLLCSDTGDLVFEYDFVSGSDNGVTIDYQIITKEWRFYDRILQFEWWMFDFSGKPAFQVTVDDVSYILALNFAFLPLANRRYVFNLIGQKMQLNLAGSGSSFVLTHLGWAARQISRWARP